MWRMMLREAGMNLLAARQRSLLALLGLVVGGGAVIALIDLGDVATAESLRQLRLLGTDLLVIQSAVPLNDAYPIPLVMEDATELSSAIRGLDSVVPIKVTGQPVRSRGVEINANIIGAPETLQSFAHLTLARGRPLSRFDGTSTVAVLGADLAATLSARSGAISPGDSVVLGDYAFTIIGILAYAPANPLYPVEFNNSLLLSLPAAARLMPSPGLQAIIGRVRNDASTENIAKAVDTWFRPRTHGRGVMIRTAEQVIGAMEQQKQLYGTMLTMIAGISLIIGGAGVMNVMLVAVAERRAEIGIRLAVGARRRDIRALFLMEATLLSGTGGGAGIVLGLLAAWILANLAHWPFAVDPAAILLGTGSAIAIGLAAGVVPAMRAARLDPVTVLRTE